MKKIKNLKIKFKFSKGVLILFVIILIGIFLRTYQFKNWMTFNPDQARDALLVQDVLNKKATLPLLGPQAGNTAFKLGPIFYYFEIASAKIFGSEAYKMAFPDLFFSILTIPLLFVFLIKYFSENKALLLTSLYTTSFFAITYSRFAFNPNSIPFFTLLFLLSLNEIIGAGKKEKYWSAIMLGIAMGVGAQLHALLFLAMPVTALGCLIFLFYRRIFIWRSVLFVLGFFLVFNVGQIFGEVQTGGANLKAFFSGAGSETKNADNNLIRNISNDVVCHVQGTAYIMTSLGGGDKCNLMKLPARIQKKGLEANFENIIAGMIGGTLLFGGIILGVRSFRKEKNAQKRVFLALVGIYSLVIFLIFIAVAGNISIRYYIAVSFVSFVALGLWFDFISEKMIYKGFLAVVLVLACIISFFNFKSIALATKQYMQGKASTIDNAVFGEVQNMSENILNNSKSGRKIYLAGKKQYLKRFFMPMTYFTKQKNVSLIKIEKKKSLEAGSSFFYVAKKQSKKAELPQLVEGHRSLEVKNFGNISLTSIEN